MIEKAISLGHVLLPPLWEFLRGRFPICLLRQYDEAVSRFLENDPTGPRSFYMFYLQLACAYVELDRLDDASDAIKTALEITPPIHA